MLSEQYKPVPRPPRIQERYSLCDNVDRSALWKSSHLAPLSHHNRGHLQLRARATRATPYLQLPGASPALHQQVPVADRHLSWREGVHCLLGALQES